MKKEEESYRGRRAEDLFGALWGSTPVKPTTNNITAMATAGIRHS